MAESEAEVRAARFLEAWARKTDGVDLIYGLGMFPDENRTRDLLATDVASLLSTIRDLREAECGCPFCPDPTHGRRNG